jgi:hypothetical protein
MRGGDALSHQSDMHWLKIFCRSQLSLEREYDQAGWPKITEAHPFCDLCREEA